MLPQRRQGTRAFVNPSATTSLKFGTKALRKYFRIVLTTQRWLIIALALRTAHHVKASILSYLNIAFFVSSCLRGETNPPCGVRYSKYANNLPQVMTPVQRINEITPAVFAAVGVASRRFHSETLRNVYR